MSWLDSRVSQLVQNAPALLVWNAWREQESGESVGSRRLCRLLAPPRGVPLTGECPAFPLHDGVPLSCCVSMHPYVFCACVRVCLNVHGCSDTPTAPHLSAGCSLRATPHPSSSGSYPSLLASSSYRNEFIIHLIAFSCFSVQQIRLVSLFILAVY